MPPAATQEEEETVYDNINLDDDDKNNGSTNNNSNTKIIPLELDRAENNNSMEDAYYDYDDEDDDDDDMESAALLLADEYGEGGGIKRANSKYYKRSSAYDVVFQRWIQLLYLSLAAALSDWICFSTAAAPEEFELIFDKEGASANLIDLFLYTNVLTCLTVTDVVARWGLQRSFQFSVVAMTMGSWLRSYAFLQKNYELFCLGTVLVGAAQPFFQCTPPLLSATWFAQDERARATAIALNFNQIGIAIAFLLGGIMGTTQSGLNWYFGLMAVFCSITAVGAMIQFENRPVIPPSASELEKRKNPPEEQPFYKSAFYLIQTPGFLKALSAFICSIAITNIVGATLEELLNRGGVSQTWQVAIVGGGFEIAIVLGGVVLCKYVDKTKAYKTVTLWCLILSAICIMPLGWTIEKIGPEPWIVITSLLTLGFFVGPIQPINAELAVDVTYPHGDETAVESLQQIGGNLISALAMPIAIRAQAIDWDLFVNTHSPNLVSDVRGDMVLLLVSTIITYIYFRTFDAPLKRSQADDG